MSSSAPIPSGFPDAELPDETPEALSGIAERLKHALEEILAARAEAEAIAQTSPLSAEVERMLTVAEPFADRDASSDDRRLYLPNLEGWKPRVKTGPAEYCFYKKQGENWHHLLIDGELYLHYGSENVCLNCALQHGILTDDRLFWQKGRRHRSPKATAIGEGGQSIHNDEQSPNES